MLVTPNATGNCLGLVVFRYFQVEDFAVKSANIDGRTCTSAAFYVSCMYDIPPGGSSVVYTQLEVGPYARGDTMAEISGLSQPYDQEVLFEAEGRLSVSQTTSFVVPGVDNSGSAQLVVRNSGPSGAKGVQVTEQFPAFVSVATDSADCQFDDQLQTLQCSWPELDPGAQIVLPLQLSAAKGLPPSQLSTKLQAQADVGSASGTAQIVVSGNAVVALQAISPAGEQPVYSRLTDNVSVTTMPQLASPIPAPGIPVQWTVHFAPGLQVQSVTLGPNSGTTTCSYSQNSVTCSQPNFGSGQPQTEASASITFQVTEDGTLPVTLTWSSDEGSGSSVSQVQASWEP